MAPNIVVIVRSLMAFLSLLIYARILGKQQLSQLTFFDYVNGITIGSIAANMSTDLSSIAFHQFIGLSVWMVATLGLQLISTRNRWLDKVMQGEPTVVVHNGKILEENLKKLRYPYMDLMQQLRQAMVFNVGDVEFAVYEPNGQLSVLLKSQKKAVTPADLQIPTRYEGLATELIIDGKVIAENLASLGLDERWLQNELALKGINDLKQVAFASLDTSGNLFVDCLADDLGEVVKDPSDFKGPQ